MVFDTFLGSSQHHHIVTKTSRAILKLPHDLIGSCKVLTVRKNQGKSGNLSIVWKNLCFSDKIREFLFLLNICVASTNCCT